MSVGAAVLSACRVCGGGDLAPVLDLGPMPLANALRRADELAEPEARHPLALVRCPSCTLVQLTVALPPEALFSEYLYQSSFADTMLRHAETLASRLAAERQLGAGSLVVEVASNDGYLLRNYVRMGVPVLGIDPAKNLAAIAEARGVRTLTAFFDRSLASALRAEGARADVIHAHNVLAHVPDPVAFAEGVALLLREGGLAVFEVPYLLDFLQGVEFDTVYHEHLSYFSVQAVQALFARGGLTLLSAERIPIHGGSVRLLAARAAEARAPSSSVASLVSAEQAVGIGGPEPYARFAAEVERIRRDLRALLAKARSDGLRIAGYGASAKGTTLLNACGIDEGTIEFVVDRSPAKQGRFTPGLGLPILPPSALLERMPDLALLLAWNFADEILAQQADYRARGGRFILPVPTARVV